MDAKLLPGATEQGDCVQYLTFTLGQEAFAISIRRVKEIIEYRHLTGIPMMPTFIRGVLNLRGAVIPVIDLPARFGNDSSQITRRSCIVMMEVETDGQYQDIGILVDTVSEVIEITPANIEAPPAFGAGIRTDFIHGMGQVEGRFLVILNVERVLSIDELASLTRIAA